MKTKIIIISIILLLVMVFVCGCIPFMEKIGIVSPTDEEQLTPEKASPDGLVKVLIGFKEKPGAAQQAMVKGVGGKIKYTYHIVDAIAASIPEASIAGLKANPNVTYLEMDGLVYALDDELDNSWGVKRIGAGVVHDLGNKGAGVKVAIIDSGIDYSHPDLDANYGGGYDFVNKDTDPMDDNGHGTHVAGTVAAEDNDIGVVGVAPAASLYALKVLDSGGSGYFSDIIKALEWCMDNGIQVTNNSYGSPINPGKTVKDAFDNSASAGVLHVAAAGNYGNSRGTGNNVGYPARFESVIAVAATDKSNKRASFSSTGNAVELAAPGVDINSTLLGGGYGEGSGTSMASPHVAGTAALVIAAGISDVRGQLQTTADDLGATGWDSKYGWGLVDADEAAGAKIPPLDTGTIAGNVAEAEEGSAIAGAEVVVEDTNLSATTDASGYYEITEVAVGDHTVIASATGYIEESNTAEVLKDQTTGVDFTLTPAPTIPVLCVNVNTDKNNYSLGESVSITVTVTENIGSGQIVEGASVQTEITTASGRKYTKDGITDLSGKVIFKFKTKKPDGKGIYSVTANASKSGYEPGSSSIITFEVK